VGRDGRDIGSDLGRVETGIFLLKGLDWPNQIDPAWEFSFVAQAKTSGAG
jgi:hypothetical protein